ncbi:MAG: hypothetical protein MJ002_03060 [Paludibacteraceae bacterium]|nr:hypothetical protein [Paludibacteraceae bacterium]
MKKAFILAIAILATVTLTAQNKKACDMKLQKNKRQQAKEWMEKKQEQRKAYLIYKMELKDSERAAFESIYDNYRGNYNKSLAIMRRAVRQMNDSCSEEQYEKFLETISTEKNTQAKLDFDFYQAMKKSLSARQIYLYYKADKDFNKLMMRDMRPNIKKRKK